MNEQQTTAAPALQLTDLTTIGNDPEPRVHDLKLAEVLGFDRPRNIRLLIERNIDELRTYGEVCFTAQQTSEVGGRPGKACYLNEPQALLLCMFSRTGRAAEVRRVVISVFLAWRRGHAPQPASRLDHRHANRVRSARLRLAEAAGALDSLGIDVRSIDMAAVLNFYRAFGRLN